MSGTAPSAPRRLPPRFWRSASLRLASVFATLFALGAILFMLFVWWATIGLLQRQVQAAISADAQALSERFQDGGLPALILSIQDRLEQNVDDDALYLIVDPAGVRIAGNLQHWPAGIADSGWHQMPVSREGMKGMAELRAFALPGNFRLLIGRDVRARNTLHRLLADTLFYALLLVTALGLVGAVLVRGLFRRMVRNVARTTAAIAAGQLDRRVPLAGSGDEFDRVAETINDMLDRIARLMNGVRQVSNAIAHDLRTPITRARARLEDAATHAQGEGELRAAIERAVADLDDIAGVFDALLRIAEIEAGARRSAFAAVDLAPLLADLAELYGVLAEEKEMRLVLQAPGSLSLLGDRNLIQQAVANLLDNAIKFSCPGGIVRLDAARVGQQARIAVTDHGIGMPAQDMQRATERFFRGEQARSTPGSGLGLALVDAVAHLHGGSFRLEDAMPGVRGILMLPLAERPDGEPPPPAMPT